MILQLTEDYRIETSATQAVEFILQKRHVITGEAVAGKVSKRAGQVTWRPVGYYGSLEAACKRFVDHNLVQLEGKLSLADVLREVRRLKALIQEAMNG